MTAQLVASELANLIQESKRKNNDLRQAAEKSLEELKSLKVTSEAQISAELSQRSNFVNPFIIACGTKNVKFTGIAIVCLQRLIASRALPRFKLSQVLEALQQATSAGLDVQLKILQALPSLLSNYAADVKGELLVTALNISFILQSSKNAIVNNASAATLQQLVVSVFDKVVAEDGAGGHVEYVGEAPSQQGPVPVQAAAMDAYRVFNDICLLTENQRPEYLRFSGMPQTFGLELIESVLTNHAAIFTTHPEQADILRTRVMPFIISALRGKPNFATSVRLVRILFTLLRRHLTILPSESGDALDILTQLLDQDTALWKRSLCMEVFRGIFADHALLRRIFMLYDAKEGEKNILKNLTAAFVRVSTEKPTVIGLGLQSTLPVANPYANAVASTDQAMLEASGVTGIISGSVSSDGHNTGISTHWSTMRSPCIDQLDKTDPPSIPESYVYSLTLACITSLSEGLAKFILPLTVPTEGRRKKSAKPEGGRDSPALTADERPSTPSEGLKNRERSASSKRNPLPVNPLTLETHPLYPEIKVCAAFIDECWPAILATCSTFLYSALDSEYYHGLVRAFQKFAHVAGLLQLTTPRDAFLTTLGKAAVPPNVFTACLNSNSSRRDTPLSATSETGSSLFSNARGLLTTESASAQAAEKQRQQSMDITPATLNTRNLLCLRALLNLGIALGPTLSSTWRILLETLQQADFVLFTSGKAAGRTPLATRGPDQQAEQEATVLLSNFNSEIRAVETAASRLFESTADFPNSAFVEIVEAVCALLVKHVETTSETTGQAQPSPPPGPLRTPTFTHKRVLSITTSPGAGANQEDQFALAKLGDLASINMERLLSYPPEVSGWTPLITELIDTLSSSTNTPPVRARAAETLVRILLEAAGSIATQQEDVRGPIQIRILEAFHNSLSSLRVEGREVSLSNHATDMDIHRIVLEGLKGLLENCGESLVQGWDTIFAIIDTIFVKEDLPNDPSSTMTPRLMTRSVKLIRPSFASLQLICSDFLPSLPNLCFLNLVDTLYKFCTQDDDLNVALTTVTFFWAISDFLSSNSKSMSLTQAMVNDSGDEALLKLAADPSHQDSGGALWMLLLLRLTSVATDQRLELRNSAVQTLLRIISAYGDSLSPEAWLICIRSVILRLLASIEDELRAVHTSPAKARDQDGWTDTANVIIRGVSGLFASYLQVLLGHEDFATTWQQLLGHFARMLDVQILDINASVYSAVREILRSCAEHVQPRLGKGSLDLTWDLWSRGIPVPEDGKDDKSADNQKCLLVWVEALLELYGLIKDDFGVGRIRRMLTLLRDAMQHATPGAYASDTEYVTPLQGRILQVFCTVQTDVPRVPSAMITQIAEFVSLAFAQENPDKAASEKRTFVAMSKESMSILQSLVIKHAAETDIYETGAFAAALAALAKPIILKYKFKIVTKSSQPWREATKTVLAVLKATLPHIRAIDKARSTVQEIWQIIVSIANGIISADCSIAPSGTDIMDDQKFDISSFHKLRELIIPALGAEVILDKTRKAYAEGLFRTSIIHAPAPAEALIIYGSEDHHHDNTNGSDAVVDLDLLYKQRRGRTIDPPPTHRSAMAEVCLDELFALVAIHEDEEDESPPSKPTSTSSSPPTQEPIGTTSSSSPSSSSSPDKTKTIHESTHPLHVHLALTAAPYLILRCALSIRSYVADQPLRGRMPQPLSQRKELYRILRGLVDLRSEPDAIPDTPNVDSETKKHLLRLYPLLVSMVKVAGTSGDDRVLGMVGEALDVVGGELGCK
ncbi:hypothetical protein GE21DRAFT_8877 [Neurospora crassa]|uniref:Endosomal peripheral membrane protein n=1 Tax=Neurospora crassa (strain ATCC 24698 / 74-OR23-1A / CBS 708.71 / DSM 1257 / FGSC 987) TaxID=367110 RepID=Q7S5S4_NEUCR|nr:hypothetical protein NCU05634 [Neurospora crassa OR74A]EAA30877.3 hypothetical protein NCU05634 [Neurospora crassa OR74A]KHE80562.1 hypothetical protein GE21DRAFT_8877 [Neurospora crassa]|eukprot:XP_960113.3 hypothetical protein NCU05634 [Neurospora crassa OR74A]